MFEKRNCENESLYLLRLSARISGIVSLTVLLLFIFGENSDWLNITAGELVGLLFFPVGLIVGLIFAWREELLGGAIAIGSVAAFYLVYGLLLNGTLAMGWWFICFGLPGILFLAYGVAAARENSNGARTGN